MPKDKVADQFSDDEMNQISITDRCLATGHSL